MPGAVAGIIAKLFPQVVITMKTLRELRLLHWRQLAAVRKMQKFQTLNNDPAQLERLAMEHLGAVQLLNDYVSGTAEQDDDSSVQGVPLPPDCDRKPVHIGSILSDASEALARYAAHLEGRSQPSLQTAERAGLTRELAAILFRAAELEKNGARSPA